MVRIERVVEISVLMTEYTCNQIATLSSDSRMGGCVTIPLAHWLHLWTSIYQCRARHTMRIESTC